MYGYIDTKGKYVINPQFDNAGGFSDNGLANVKSGDKWGYINIKGEYVIEPQFDIAYTFDGATAVVKQGNKWGLIDKNGVYKLTPTYADIGRFSEGLAYFADDNGRIGYLDTDGQEIIPAQFDYLAEDFGLVSAFFDDGYAIVRLGDQFGVIDKSGDYVINPHLDGLWIVDKDW